VIVERLAAEEGVEVQKALHVSIGRQLVQVRLVETVQLVSGVAVVEAPEPPVGQDAPLGAGVLHVENL